MSLQNEIINAKIAAADVTQNLTATYASDRFTGCGGTAISLGLRAGFSAELFEKLNTTLDELIELRRRCHPIPVDMRRVPDVLALLKQMRRGEPIVLNPLPTLPQRSQPIDAVEIDTELVGAVLTGDYDSLCERRGWSRQQLSKAITANAEKMRTASTDLSRANHDRAQL
jgi:hypothetical protein